MKEQSRVGGRYRLIKTIKNDGLGQLWAAQDERSGLSVAIRMLERGQEDERRVGHFRASAFAAARLDHPNIPQVLDEGLEGRTPFIVTAWPAGRPLSHWRGTNPPWGFVRSVLTQICDALAHIHANELLHLDLRPDHILIEQRPSGPFVHLTDIGCSRFDEGYSDQVGGAQITLKYLGTVHYMAPEVADAPSWQTGSWSDLYSLGLVLWELLAGTLPNSSLRGVALLLHRAANDPPTLPIGIGAPYHGVLRNLLRRLMARDPTDRPRTAAQVRQTIESMPGDPIWVEPLPKPYFTQASFEPARAAAAAFPLRPLSAGLLVGRDQPLRTTWSALTAVVGGQGSHLVVLHGPKGTGKSHLARTIVEHASTHGLARTWRVRFSPKLLPRSGLERALEDLLLSAGTNAVGIAARTAKLDLLIGADPEGLELVLPSILRPDSTRFARPGREPDPGLVVSHVGAVDMVAGVFFELLRRVSRTEAVLLWLDDLDHASEPAGTALIRRILSEPTMAVCIVATVRKGSEGDARLQRQLPPGTSITWEDFQPLGHALIRAYVSQRIHAEGHTLELITSAIEQWPTAMRALCDTVMSGQLMPSTHGSVLVPGTLLPETDGEMFGAMMSMLPSSGKDALVPDTLAGLALGQLPLDPPLLKALKRADPHRPFERALAAGERARLIERRPTGGWRFTSTALQNWLAERVGERAPSWHRRWAKTLMIYEGRGRGRFGNERAGHAAALGEHPAELSALLDAAAWALAPGQSSHARGLAAVERGRSKALAMKDLSQAARAERLRAELVRQAGQYSAARSAIYDAEAHLSQVNAPVEQAWCVMARAWLDLEEAKLESAARGFGDARQAFAAVDNQPGVQWARLGLAQLASITGRHDDARKAARDIEVFFDTLGGMRGTLAARILRAGAADRAGDHDIAERRYAVLQAVADERRWLLELTAFRLHRARLTLHLGRGHDALRLLDEAASITCAVQLEDLHAWTNTVRPAALLAAGEFAGVEAALKIARLPTPRHARLAVEALEAGLKHPTANLRPDLRTLVLRWAQQVATTIDR